MGLIYMRISPSGGQYIGKTVLSEQRRWKFHINGAYNSNASDYNCILSKAIRKYGADNFSVIILEDNIATEKLNEREIYWISQYNTYYQDNPLGYNMTRGGEGVSRLIDDELLTLWNQGLTLSEIGLIVDATPYYIGQKLNSLGVDNKLFQKRAAQKRALAVMMNNPKNQQIYELWQQGYSLAEINNQLHITVTHAANMLRTLYKVPNEEVQKRKNQAISTSKKKPIIQYDMNDNFIKEWNSATDAAKDLKLDQSSIRACIKNKRKSCGGFKWKAKIKIQESDSLNLE